MIDDRQPLSFAPDVVLQVIDGEAVILKLNDELVFSLNDTGARIAQLITEHRPLEVMVDILTREYDSSRESLSDEVKRLVHSLHARGIVVARSA